MHTILAPLRAYFDSGRTRPIPFRKEQLSRLRTALKASEAALLDALHRDLRKPAAEAYATEIGQVIQEISHTLRELDNWAKPQRKPTPLAFFPSRSFIVKEPLGVVLIVAPWNYPLQLLLMPLVGALAAGNCAVCKPSELAPATGEVLEKMLSEVFPRDYVCVLQGDGAIVIPELLREGRPDHIFFTGSIPVGREMLRMAAPQLIPVTLELGGKSPVVVDRSADIVTAARRIVLGKFVNAGQTCIAPDYLLVHRSVQIPLVKALEDQIRAFYGDDPRSSPDYGRIIHAGRFHKLSGYLQQGHICWGGQTDEDDLYIAPTLMDEVSPDNALLQEEIFGPILPIVPFDAKEEALAFIRQRPWPLALYVFAGDKGFTNYFVHGLSFGGGCINNTLVHFGNPDLPVGGVAYSGMGSYHGFDSFRTFSHHKSITQSATWPDLTVKYPPYKGKLTLFKRFFR